MQVLDMFLFHVGHRLKTIYMYIIRTYTGCFVFIYYNLYIHPCIYSLQYVLTSGKITKCIAILLFCISYGLHKLWSSSHVASPDQHLALLMISMRAAMTYLFLFCTTL